MPRCYAPDAAATGDRVTVTDADAHHLRHVLRLSVGDALIVFDGRGREWDARLVDASRAGVTVELGAARTPIAEPPVPITLAVAILKGDAFDAVIRDAIALGVSAIQPIVSERVTVAERVWSRESVANRWQRVAIASVKQCGRAVIPAIAPVRSLASALERAATETRLVCVEPLHGLPSGGLGPRPASGAWLFVGPEGGWSAEELTPLRSGDARLLSLGPRTLRAELAPVVALATLWAGWGEPQRAV